MGCLTVFFRHAIWFRKSKQKQQQQWKQIETCSANVSDCLSVCAKRNKRNILQLVVISHYARMRAYTIANMKKLEGEHIRVCSWVEKEKLGKNVEKMWKKEHNQNIQIQIQ